MSWAGSEMIRRPAVDVYVGTRAVVVSERGEPRVVCDAVDFADAVALLQTCLAKTSPRRRLRLWLSGGLCRPFLLPGVAGVRGSSEMRNIAAALAPRQTGLEGECVAWVDSGNSPRRIAVAVQRRCLDELHQAVANAAARHRIISIRPWWAALHGAVVRRDEQTVVVAVQDCDSLTVLAGQAGFTIANTVTPIVDREAADAALARMLLSADEVSQGPRVHARLIPRLDPPAMQNRTFVFEPCVEWIQ